MPGTNASGSVPQAQDPREPSNTESPVDGKMACPNGVLQLAARASVMFGATWMSAYKACPDWSVAIVLTHGTPCVDDSARTTSAVLRDRPSSNQVFSPRRLPSLASRSAYP